MHFSEGPIITTRTVLDPEITYVLSNRRFADTSWGKQNYW